MIQLRTRKDLKQEKISSPGGDFKSSLDFVSLNDLTRTFGDITAVDALTLKIPQGVIFGLVGPDGAGKTTTLRMLAGLLSPTAGTASVAGCDVARETQRVKDRIGYMAQKFGLYSDLTVDENIRFYADLYGLDPGKRQEWSDYLLAVTKMEAFRNRRAGHLSGGMKQKLALTCTLLHNPPLLLLDEPTNGVDPVSRRDFWSILYRLVKEGLTVIVSTAYLDEAERCNSVALLYRGRLIQTGAPAQLPASLPEKFLRIECRDNRKARSYLIGHKGVLSVESSGRALHVFFDPHQTSIAELKKKLEDESVGPCDIESIDPPLEDLFIALVRKEERKVGD
ncbi:MAG TPA: ABC transporter ATP-binding protein [Acidobacteriota bacterium]|nr:ABC transporter ATP-binding protein [Acidobacteriota bacterium]